MVVKKVVKPIAKLTSHKKDINYDIFNNNVDFVLLRSKNDLNSQESIVIVPVENGGNEENEIVCKIEKLEDMGCSLKPFMFQSLHDNFILINDKMMRKGQRIILQDKDKISVAKNQSRFFEFYDLRKSFKIEIPPNVLKGYFVEKLLGKGPNGCVYLVHNIRTLKKLALKGVEKVKGDPQNDYAFEAKIMNSLIHPNIVRLLHVHDEVKHTYLFTEYLNYQDLLNFINSKPKLRLDEFEARDCFYQITQGLKYLHRLNISHRDIKCDNIFVHKENDKFICKIGDFGLSAYDKDLTQACGTVLYSPPEMFYKNQMYKGTKCDIWSFGVVLFCMVSGKFPFHKSFEDCGTIETQIKAGILRFRCDSIWDRISYECKHLICCMINTDPICRYDIIEVENHQWLKSYGKLQNPRKRSVDLTLLKNVNCVQRFVLKKPKIALLT